MFLCGFSLGFPRVQLRKRGTFLASVLACGFTFLGLLICGFAELGLPQVGSVSLLEDIRNIRKLRTCGNLIVLECLG